MILILLYILTYEKKIELLDAFQKGYSLNPRSSNFYQIKKEEQEEQEM